MNDFYYLSILYKEACDAYTKKEVPISSIIVDNHSKNILGKSHNMVELLNDPTAHAEMIAISSACNNLKNKYLVNTTLYVTLEPCVMCAGAINKAQISRLVFISEDKQYGFRKYSPSILNKKIKIEQIYLDDYQKLIDNFFYKLRKI